MCRPRRRRCPCRRRRARVRRSRRRRCRCRRHRRQRVQAQAPPAPVAPAPTAPAPTSQAPPAPVPAAPAPSSQGRASADPASAASSGSAAAPDPADSESPGRSRRIGFPSRVPSRRGPDGSAGQSSPSTGDRSRHRRRRSPGGRAGPSAHEPRRARVLGGSRGAARLHQRKEVRRGTDAWTATRSSSRSRRTARSCGTRGKRIVLRPKLNPYARARGRLDTIAVPLGQWLGRAGSRRFVSAGVDGRSGEGRAPPTTRIDHELSIVARSASFTPASVSSRTTGSSSRGPSTSPTACPSRS